MVRTKLGANAQFSGPQLGLTTIGDHTYAFSGIKTCAANTEVTLLEFSTGKGYIVGKLEFYQGDLDTDWGKSYVYFNNAEVIRQAIRLGQAGFNETFDVLYILIPPLTTVTCSIEFGTESDAGSCSFVGRVYA